jgi:tetratricopeptide (TPR) repeat protein
MTTDEISTWLTDGLAAAKAGERVKARELLMHVVEADETNLQAWLSLSDLVTTLEDREVCLENALTLDPSNAIVRESLESARAQIAATPEIEPESELRRVETDELRVREAQVKVDFSDGQFDEPLLCVYCGRLTGENDKRCPNCKRPLYITALKRERPAWLWVGWTIGVVDTFFSIGMLLALLTVLASVLSAARFSPQPIDIGQILGMYLGQSTPIPPPAQAAALSVLPREVFYFRFAYIVFTAVVTLGLLTRRRIVHLLYIAGIALAAIGLYFTVSLNRTFISAGVPLTPVQGVLQVAIDELLGMMVKLTGILTGVLIGFKALLAFLMEDDFAKVTERLWSVIDKTVREPTTAFVRAKTYMTRGMWTLAAMYLRRCISLQPAVVDYHLALAESYAHLGRYQQSLAMLDQADRLQPDSTIVVNLRRAIMEHQSKVNPSTAPETTGGL